MFSGLGGFDLAARDAGFENLFDCETNGFCAETLKYHFPNSKHYGDIRKTDFSEWRGKVGILSGGFPCQPFSCAGRRKGTEDDRYLWPEMLRAIREIQPAFVVGENVAGILSLVQPGRESEMGSEATLFGEDNGICERRQQYVVETICQDLEREGYSVQPFVIPACAVGAPHRRDRVWFVARRTPADCPDRGLVVPHERTGADIHEGEGLGTRRKDRLASDSRCNRFGKRPDEQEPFEEREGKAHDSACSENGASADTDVHGHTPRAEDEGTKGDGRGDHEQPQERGEQAERHCGLAGLPRDASHAGSNQCKAFHTPAISEEQVRVSKGIDEELPAIKWDGFPTTQPVIRRGDDGLPFDVDDLAVPFTRWRNESIRAYGNAIVPQVAYEIFTAIRKEMTR